MEHDVVLEPDIEVETMDLILPLILNGLGIGFLPDLYVKDLLKSNQIQEIRMEEKIPVDDENSPIPTINEVEGEEEDYNSDNKVNNEDEE